MYGHQITPVQAGLLSRLANASGVIRYRVAIDKWITDDGAHYSRATVASLRRRGLLRPMRGDGGLDHLITSEGRAEAKTVARTPRNKKQHKHTCA